MYDGKLGTEEPEVYARNSSLILIKQLKSNGIFIELDISTIPNLRFISVDTINKFPVKKYFVTNGMRLDRIKDAIFKHRVDIMAISLDGAKAETNNKIRINSDLDFIVKQLKDIVAIKKQNNLTYPYMNFVMTMFDD